MAYYYVCFLLVSLPGKALIVRVVLCCCLTSRVGAAILRGRSAAHIFVLFPTGEGGGWCRVSGGFALRI